jgi:hypothetical protein
MTVAKDISKCKSSGRRDRGGTKISGEYTFLHVKGKEYRELGTGFFCA